MAGGRGDAEGPAERGQPVRHALHAGAHRGGRLVEPAAVVADGEREGPAVVPERHPGLPGLRVLRHVLQRLQHAEIHGGLDVLGVSAQARRFHRDRNRRLPRLRLECGRQPQVGEQRRVDPPGEIPEIAERARYIVLQLAE